MKYYIIAGEASGDLHAANLMKEIRIQDPEAVFRVWGGDRMLKQGGELVKHYKELAFMGFYEVLANLRTIFSNIRFCKKDLLIWQPDVIILVDYPGFNLRIAEFAHNQGFRVFYYISPQIWAWKKSRVKKIRKFVERMYVILPFEKDFYAGYGVDVDYAGHPLLDALAAELPCLSDADTFKKRNRFDERPVIALLPGSRRQEIARVLPLLISVTNDFPEHQFVIAGAAAIEPDFYHKHLAGADIPVIFNQTHDLLHNAVAALVTSGTATLETALMSVPQVVCYKSSWLSFQIARRIVDVKYISLVNLIMDKEVVKELIQNDLNRENLIHELSLLFDDSNRARMLSDYSQLRLKLGGEGASATAAKMMIARLNSKK